MTAIRRKFSPEFKRDAVRLVLSGEHSLAQIARDLDLRPDMLRRWRKQLEEDPRHAFPGKGRLKPEDEELRRLRRDVARLREERDILKRALAIFSEPRR